VKRRQFITLVGGAAAWPVAAHAQQSLNRIPVVGVLWHAGSAEEEDVYLTVLVKAFNDLGYVEGKKDTRVTERVVSFWVQIAPLVTTRRGGSRRIDSASLAKFAAIRT
jgi:hypothetical protein